MHALATPYRLTVEDYLEGEEVAEVRHEFVGGLVHAMAGESDRHNLIVGNIYTAVRLMIRGGPCRAYIENVKVRITFTDRDVFYYPDVLVTCDPRDTEPYYKRFPKLIFEVLSDSTESTDRREKFWHYTSVDTFEEYVLVAQDRVEVTIFRRATKWEPEIFTDPDGEVFLNSLNARLSIREIYEGVVFAS